MSWRSLLRPDLMYDAMNVVALALIGSGVGVMFGTGPALIAVGALVLGLNLYTAIAGRG